MSIPCGAVVLLLLRKYDLPPCLFSVSHPESVCSLALRHKMEASFQGGCSVEKLCDMVVFN